MASHWSQGLLSSLKDPSLLVLSSPIAAVIKDKYPKAKFHYLVLPYEDISSIFQLNKTHLKLLEEMYLLAVNAIEISRSIPENFKIGFHAEPSMQRVHLHVISLDFLSSSLKTKKHWNSFNTEFFLLYEKVYKELEVKGCIARLSKNEIDSLLRRNLKCHLCESNFKDMPSLKRHLESH